MGFSSATIVSLCAQTGQELALTQATRSLLFNSTFLSKLWAPTQTSPKPSLQQTRHSHFRSCVIRADALLETLRHLPQIERLTFIQCEFEEGVFEALASSEDIDWNLRRLDLWQCGGEGLQTASLIQFIQSISIRSS